MSDKPETTKENIPEGKQLTDEEIEVASGGVGFRCMVMRRCTRCGSQFSCDKDSDTDWCISCQRSSGTASVYKKFCQVCHRPFDRRTVTQYEARHSNSRLELGICSNCERK